MHHSTDTSTCSRLRHALYTRMSSADTGVTKHSKCCDPHVGDDGPKVAQLTGRALGPAGLLILHPDVAHCLRNACGKRGFSAAKNHTRIQPTSAMENQQQLLQLGQQADDKCGETPALALVVAPPHMLPHTSTKHANPISCWGSVKCAAPASNPCG